MSISLARIIQQHQSKKVSVRGVEVTVRALSAAESREIERQLPRPILGKDATAEDRQQIISYEARRRAVIVGVAADLEHASGETWSPKQTPGWVEGYADHILTALSEIEILSLYDTQVGLAMGSMVPDEKDRIGTDTAAGN